ncbi:MAG TPA: hypothetical protein VFC34_04840, partial [Puia sp.]|nr:hypothetical protein [Puia sp.]
MKRTAILFIVIFCFHFTPRAQEEEIPPPLTYADTVLGSLNPERAFNVLRYDISITPDYEGRSITGKNTITYLDSGLVYMQIDLQEPLIIDSILYRDRSLFFKREGNAWLAYVGDSVNRTKHYSQDMQSLTVYY